MEDDEDLEFLRLAALKSLNNKKETELPHISPPSATSHLINGNINHVQPISESARQLVNDYFSATAPTLPFDAPLTNAFVHTGGAYLHANFDKIDLNDPYASRNVHPIGGSVLGDYQPPYVANPSPNVQLSPRSAAFVLQNNDILMRRKTDRSPVSPSRSHSPLPYRRSPGRWSPTPPPTAKSRSPKRSPSYGYGRSISPPPLRRTPPYTRNRSISRSPQRRRHSPFPLHVRRSKSRSPLPRNSQNNYRTQPRPRSPVAHSSGGGNRRANSPPNRNLSRGWRGSSPPPATANRNNRNHNRRSVSPRANDEPSNYRGQVRRRSRSPLTNKNEPRRRSTSRSPGRKYPRNANVRRRRTPPPPQAPPVTQKLPPRNNIQPARNINGPRPRSRPRRTASPPANSHRRSKTKSPQPSQPKPRPENDTEDKEPAKQEQTKAAKKVENPNPSDERKVAASEPSKPAAKTEQEIEDELLASTNDEASNSDSDNDDDGIDLFASEESESENEGRFKLTSHQTEKPSAAVSFSKLGTVATTELRELEEVRGEKASTASRKNGRDDRDKDRERGGSRIAAYRREPNGRYGGRKQESDTKARDRDSNRSWKGSKSESRRKDLDADVASEKDRKRTMFKSTFQAVDPESRTKTPDAGTTRSPFIVRQRQSVIFW